MIISILVFYLNPALHTFNMLKNLDNLGLITLNFLLKVQNKCSCFKPQED
jgi:hypothetical protein